MRGRRDAYIWLEGLKHASQIYASLSSNLVYEIFEKGKMSISFATFKIWLVKFKDKYISSKRFEMSISRPFGEGFPAWDLGS